MENLKARSERMEKYTDKYIEVHKNSMKGCALYVVYLALFVVIIASQLELTETFKMNHIKEEISSTEMNLPPKYTFYDHTVYNDSSSYYNSSRTSSFSQYVRMGFAFNFD